MFSNMFISNKGNSSVRDIFGSKVMNGELKMSNCSSIYNNFIQQPAQFSSLQLLGMFLDNEKYSIAVGNFKNRPTAKRRFQWRMIYTVGEAILKVQQFLEQRDGLKNHLILNYHQVFQFSLYLFEQMQQNSENKQFISFRNMLFNFFRGQAEGEIEKIIQIYVLCMRMWRMCIAQEARKRTKIQESRNDNIIKFPSNNQTYQHFPTNSQQELELNPIFNKHVDRTSQPNPRMGPYSVLRMPPCNLTVFKQKCKEKKKNQKNRQLNNSSEIVSLEETKLNRFSCDSDKKIEPKLSQGYILESYNSFEDDEFIKLDQQVPVNNINSKQKKYEKRSVRPWTPEQQLHFCKLYIQFDSQEMIRQFLEKQYGPDPKWVTNMQVDNKIQVLAARVYKKFMSMQTTNQSIVKFKRLKGLIISSDSITVILRRQLFKKLAAIYTAIQNCPLSNKKLVISEKIDEILQLCSSHLNTEK